MATDDVGTCLRHADNENTQHAPRRLTLRKGEKLRHRSLVQGIFAHKQGTACAYPLRVVFRALTDDELRANFRDAVPPRIDTMQMLVTVPKKKRRHAVDRVLMRRRIREAYRLNRLPFKEALDANPHIRTLGVSFIYMADTNLPYSTIEHKMRLLLKKIGDAVFPSSPANAPAPCPRP